jgi:hypothetical protein
MATSDKLQIGLTAAGSTALERLMADGLFGTESDAYKFAIAYALGSGIDPSDAAERGYQTKFNAAGGLDRDGTIRDLIAIVRPSDAERPYATAERLAEAGLIEIARRLGTHDSLADLLDEVTSTM